MRSQFPTLLLLISLFGGGCRTDANTPNGLATAGAPSLLAGSSATAPRAGATAPMPSAGASASNRPAITTVGGSAAVAGNASPALPKGGSGGATAGASGAAAPSSAGQPAPSGLPDISFSYDVQVPAGAELLECEFVSLPSDRGTIAVSSVESHYTPGSHHMQAFRTDLATIPSNQTGLWDCNAGNWYQHDRGSYYEAQQPDSHRELPAGVAHQFKPGEIVLLQSHYVNTTGADIAAHVVITLHTIDMKDVKSEAGTILFANTNFALAPHTKARVTMTCPLTQDIHPAELWSHMHKQGINFVATTSDTTAAAVLGGSLYQESNWSEPQPRIYPSAPPATLHSGSTITFYCDFDNQTDRTITYGDSAQTNEMCIFHGMYWPRMPAADEGCYNGMTSQTAL